MSTSLKPKSASAFRYFNSSPEVIRLVVMMYVRFPLSLPTDLLFERGHDICHANVHNHFNQERHLIDRQTYKGRRSAALAEWQSLVV